jgi:phosphonate transport system substrate-binding protein
VAQAADDPLVMGVFPRRNFNETARAFAPMAEYLGTRLGRKVELVTSKNFESFWKAVTERRYDIVHYNQYHYIRSAQDYEVVAHIEELGKSTLSGVVYVTRESGITTLAQLRGRSVIFGGGEDAMISYIAIRYVLLQAGLKKDDFKSLFAVNPPNAIVALSRRQAAAAGAGESILELSAAKDAVDPRGLTALATSSPLLQLPIAVRRDMPAKLRASIQGILVGMKNSEDGRQALQSAFLTGMGPAADADYDPHRKMAAAVFGGDGKEGTQFK